MKKVLMILLVVLLLGVSFGLGYLTYKDTPEEEEENVIASTVILDINPSIKIDLDKDDNVLFVTPLNEDAKDLVTEDMVGKKLTETVNQISDNLIERRYGDGDLVILVSSKDKTKADLVKETLTESLKEKDVEARVVSYVIKSDATEQEGISAGKAALIEEIANNSDLTVEELKDKSISELLSYEENIEEPIGDDTPEENPTENPNTNTTTNTGINTGNNNGTSTSYTCTPPSDLKDPAWCSWNNKRPQSCEFYYDDYSTSQARENALSRYGLSASSVMSGGYATTEAYSGASYCRAIEIVITTNTERITSYWDSHTGDFITDKRVAVPTLISKDEAKQIGINYIKNNKVPDFNEADIDYSEVSTGTDGEGGPGFYYRHQVYFRMKDGTNHTVDVDAATRQVKSYRSWTN